ncbi:putative RNA-dependent RNA polymerase [Chrysanthemum mosaic-associated virus]|uniref:RNA-directed RNA polymerase L n=2 Tax=Chrysanthemum mosaic-associated virus TaxID=2746510 RepID=A0AAU9BWW4_9VIRU|nr:putative RNA-dependent RNA polymerase [Chrysanthemum mosaic-associated virus]BCK60941.1 putative RNA-dependent RNA polymerase [Chrysanthemum mosaic-associated virus]
MSTRKSTQKHTQLSLIVDNLVRNKDLYDADDIINTFKIVLASFNSYNQPMSTGKKPQKIYNLIKNDVTTDVSDPTFKLADLLSYSVPKEEYIDIALTTIKVLEMARHDMLSNMLNMKITEMGIIVVGDEMLLSSVVELKKRLTPDLIIKHNDRYAAIEIKMRDPRFLDMSEFYNKYKVSDELDVTVINYSDRKLHIYGDLKDLFSKLDLSDSEIDLLEYMIRVSQEIRSKYSKYPLFSLYDTDEDTSIETPFITGFEQSTKDLDQYKEICSLYGDYMIEIEDAINNFDLSNQMCKDVLSNADDKLYNHVKKDVLSDIKSSYLDMVKEGDYQRFPTVNFDILSHIDKVNSDKYVINQNYKPSLYLPFITIDRADTNRPDYYKKHFGSIDVSGFSGYSLAAFNLVKNISNSDNLEVLLGTKLFYNENNMEYVATLEQPTAAAKRTKLLVKENMQSYDLNIYVNNTFSYSDLCVKGANQLIMGFKRKDYQEETHEMDCLSLQNSKSDTRYVANYLSNFKSYYTNESIIQDLRYYKSDFHDYQDIDELILDSMSYYSYYSSNLYKSLIALASINNKRYRVVQCYDQNTLCIMLPNASVNDNKPIRFFSVSITSNFDDIHLNKILGLYHDHVRVGDKYIILTKVLSLDLNRMKLLSNSFSKYLLLTSYYNTFVNYKKNKNEVNFNNILYTNMVTLQTLDVTENYKNIMMVCYSDYGNPDALIKDKMIPRLKNYTCCQLTLRMISGILESQDQRRKILKSQNQAELTKDGFDITNTGFRTADDLVLPLSKLYTSNPREILQECYLIFYLGNKTLHGSDQELIKLYQVPKLFEDEYTSYIEKNKTLIMETTNDKSYGFSFESMKLTTISAYSKLMSHKSHIRNRIQSDLDLNSSILSKPQFSSTKSMVTSDNDQPKKDVKLHKFITKSDFKTWLTSVDIADPNEFVSNTNLEIREINSFRRTLLEDDNDMKKELLPTLNITWHGEKYFITTTPDKLCRYPIEDYKISSNNKVFDEFLNLTENKPVTVITSLIDMKETDVDNNFRIFNKDQRTFTDREIYTGNKEARLCLYPIEKLFLSINNYIPEEAITIPGDKKHKKMYEQRCSVIKEGRYKTIAGQKREIIAVSSDASKWSARDAYIKFLIPIAFNPFLNKEEKWFYIYFLSRYYYKNIVITDKLLYGMVKLQNSNVTGPFEDITDNYKKNYFRVRSNWLQGNLNRISSFVHYCSTLMIESSFQVLNDIYGDSNLIRYMVHSDDSSYDCSMLTNVEENTDLKMRQDYGRYIIAIIKTCESRHSIKLNVKKTYLSTFYKEFLSTLLVGNVLSYFYAADLLPISSDLAYKSPMEDMSSLTSFINNAYAHSCPYSMVKTAICVINYVALSTYNLNNTSKKSPVNRFYYKNEYDQQYDMVPTSILPMYRFGAETAGLVPHHCADAYYIFEKILQTITIDESLSMEHQLNIENVKSFLDKCDQKYLNYIKMSMFSYDSNIFSDESEDPYQVRDMTCSTIISVGTNRKLTKKLRYKSYKEFLSREDQILMKYISHPEWIISKPQEFDDIRDNILSNYLMPNFIESLMYSTAAKDFGNRVMHSNGSIYRINIKGYTSDKQYKIDEIYDQVDTLASNVVIDPKKLLSYIETFLFSDKEVSFAIQVLLTKQEASRKSKTTVDLKITQPQSLYTRDRGALSVTNMINQLMTGNGKISNIDAKFASIIEYTNNLLNHFDLTDVKLYNTYHDIDDDYLSFSRQKKDINNDYETIITELDCCDSEEYRDKIINVRIKFKSILIKYFNEMVRFKSTNQFLFSNYPTPVSIITAVDKFSKKDVINTKVYMSSKITNRRDDYWLSRLGYYQDEHMYVKYYVGTRYKLSTNDTLNAVEQDDQKIESFSRFLSMVVRDDLIDDYHGLNVSGMSYPELVNKLKMSRKLSHKLLLHKLGEVTDYSIKYAIQNENRVMNYWPTPTASLPDRAMSKAIYMYRGTFLQVTTNTIKERQLALGLTVYVSNHGDLSNTVGRLIDQFSVDYRLLLSNHVVVPTEFATGHKLYRDIYNKVTVHEYNRDKQPNNYLCNYKVVQYDTINLKQIIINESNRYQYYTSIMKSDLELFQFTFKDNLAYNKEDLLNVCLANISNYPSLFEIILKNRLITGDNIYDVICKLNEDQIFIYCLKNYTITQSKLSRRYMSNLSKISLASLRVHIDQNQEFYKEQMKEYYGRYGLSFLECLYKHLPEFKIISFPTVLRMYETSSLPNDLTRYADTSYDIPYHRLFITLLTRASSPEESTKILLGILIYLVKKAIVGTTIYDQLAQCDSDDDSDSD